MEEYSTSRAALSPPPHPGPGRSHAANPGQRDDRRRHPNPARARPGHRPPPGQTHGLGAAGPTEGRVLDAGQHCGWEPGRSTNEKRTGKNRKRMNVEGECRASSISLTYVFPSQCPRSIRRFAYGSTPLIFMLRDPRPQTPTKSTTAVYWYM